MSTESQVGEILNATVGNGVGFFITIFKALYVFSYTTTGVIVGIFSIIVNMAPFLLSLGFFLITNPMLLLVLLECWILIKTILYKDAIDKIEYFVEEQKKIILFIYHLPKELLEIQSKIMDTYNTILTAIKNTTDTIFKLIDWLVSYSSNFTVMGIPVGSILGGTAFIVMLLGVLGYFANM